MTGFETWEALYKSDAQGFVALLVVPALFLVYLVVGPRPAPVKAQEGRIPTFSSSFPPCVTPFQTMTS